jgi:hypothetical protein
MDTSPASRRAGWRFVRRTLVGAALLLCAWMALLAMLPPGQPVAQNQWAANRITAERFLLAGDFDTVLVGSSATTRLPAAELGQQVTNLGMTGVTALSGLELVLTHVRAQGRAQGRVAIETDFLYWHDDRVLVGEALAPVRRWLLRALPAARTENQPLNVLLRLTKRDADAPAGASADPAQAAAARAVREAEVARQAVELARPLPQPDWSGALARLQAMVAELRAHGLRVAFYEMPIDPRLLDAPRQVAERAELKRRFPDVAWLELPRVADEDTTDGIHLAPVPAARIAVKLREALAAW